MNRNYFNPDFLSNKKAEIETAEIDQAERVAEFSVDAKTGRDPGCQRASKEMNDDIK